jgi:hypothetical protein
MTKATLSRLYLSNLFPEETIQKLEGANRQFIDITASTKLIRGIETESLKTKEINQEEKTNVCDWLCNNGSLEDFEKFKVILDFFDSLTSSNNQ